MNATTPIAKEAQNPSLGVRDLDSGLQSPALAEHDHQHPEPGDEESPQIKTRSLAHQQALYAIIDGKPIY